MADNWTDQELAILRELAKAGHTTREIAAKVGRTRYAVIGIMNRRKIKSGVQPTSRSKPKARPAVIGYQPFPAHGCCHWPIGDGWCGEAVTLGKPYCHAHLKKSRVHPQPEPLDVSFLVKLDQRR